MKNKKKRKSSWKINIVIEIKNSVEELKIKLRKSLRKQNRKLDKQSKSLLSNRIGISKLFLQRARQ